MLRRNHFERVDEPLHGQFLINPAEELLTG